MTAIEKHREAWPGKSDEWLFERLDRELKNKVEEIHRLLAENEELNKQLKLTGKENDVTREVLVTSDKADKNKL
jgi:hypothetical protein